MTPDSFKNLKSMFEIYTKLKHETIDLDIVPYLRFVVDKYLNSFKKR